MSDVMFLDDMLDRHREFRRYEQDGLRFWHVYTAKQAIECIEQRRPAQVFLDHDLSEDDIMCEVGGESAVPTGMVVVDHIMTMKEPPMDVIVHSCNGPAALAMVNRLEQHPAGIKVRRIAFPFLLQLLSQVGKR